MKELPYVKLRAMEPEDLDMLYRIENDEALWALGATNVPYSRFVLHEFMSSNTGDIYTDKQVRLMIEDEHGQVVGMADLMRFDPKNLRAEVGLIICKPYRRRGFARATIEKLHDYALHTLHLHQVYAVIAVRNEATRTLFREYGYVQSASLKEWLYDGQTYQDAVVLQHSLNNEQ